MSTTFTNLPLLGIIVFSLFSSQILQAQSKQTLPELQQITKEKSSSAWMGFKDDIVMKKKALSLSSNDELLKTKSKVDISFTNMKLVVPAPDVDAGPDVQTCFGAGVFIGGSPTGALDANIQWTPVTGLDNPNAQNPIASPYVNTTYVVAVTREGCTATDTVVVLVNGCELGPVAVDDFYETDQATPLVIPGPNTPYVGILDNDFNASGLYDIHIPVTDTGSFVLTSTVDPTNSILINSDGSFEYTPGSDFRGTDSFEYEICDTDVPPTCAFGVIYIVVNPCIDIQLAVWLEGPYNNGDVLGEMGTFLNLDPDGDLRFRGVLPGQEKLSINISGVMVTQPFQPYNNPPWEYMGNEGQADAAPWYFAPESTDPMGHSDYAVYHPDVTDWVLVRFRTGTILPIDMTVVEKTAAALLFKDGTIRFVEPCVLKQGELSSNMIYAQIDHRNHMAVMTPSLVDVSNDVFSWDFRVQNSFRTAQSFGQKEVESGVWVMHAGDADQVSDLVNYDITGQDNIFWGAQNGSFDMYLEGDYQLNADVTGDDKILWSFNNGISNRVGK